VTTPGPALIDTSALLAVANPRDQYHDEAISIGRRHLAAGGRWVGTTLVLSEFHGHLLQLRGSEMARSHLDALLSDPAHEWVDGTVELVREASERWLARYRDQAFSLTDAVGFEVMRRMDVTHAFAFDHHFEVAGFERLT